jgi:hypothetical protein
MENVPPTDKENGLVCVYGGCSLGCKLVDSIELYSHLCDWDSDVRTIFLRHYTHVFVSYHSKWVEFRRYTDDGIKRCYIKFD